MILYRRYYARRLHRWSCAFSNPPAQAKSLLYSHKQAVGGIRFEVNLNKTDQFCLNQDGAISTLKC